MKILNFFFSDETDTKKLQWGRSSPLCLNFSFLTLKGLFGFVLWNAGLGLIVLKKKKGKDTLDLIWP